MLNSLVECTKDLCQLKRALYYVDTVCVKQSLATGGKELQAYWTLVFNKYFMNFFLLQVLVLQMEENTKLFHVLSASCSL